MSYAVYMAGVRKMRWTFCGVEIFRSIIFRDLCFGSLFFGSFHISRKPSYAGW